MKERVDHKINDLLKLIGAYDPVELLARVSIMNLVSSNSDKPHEGSETQLEYAMSLLLACSFPKETRMPSPDVIQQVITDFNKLYQEAAMYYTLTSESKTGDETETEIILNQRLNTLHVRGDAYEQHLRQTYVDISQPHAAMMKTAYGFGPDEILDLLDYNENAAQERLDVEMAHIFGLRDRILKEGSTSSAVEEFQRAVDAMGSPEIFRIIPRSDIDRNILKAISARFGDNADFLSKFPKWQAWPLNPTIIAEKPVIEHEGKFYGFHLPFLGRNALTIVERLIQQSSAGYWENTYLKKRDNYVEQTAVELVASILKGSRSHLNLYYDYEEAGEQRRAEVDGIVIYDDCLLIIEVKASGLSEASRRGAPESIATDLKASLDKAYEQASRVLNFVRSSEEVIFTNEKGSEALKLNQSQFQRTFLISVTREMFASLSTNLHLTRALGFIKGKEWPWAVCLNDLRVIAEFSEHPTLFLHYLVRRLEANDYPSLHVTDELDLFGRFLCEGIYCKGDDNLQEFDKDALGSFSSVIDEYYDGLKMGESPTKRKYPLPDMARRLIATLESVKPKNFATAALYVHGFDTATLEKLGDGVIQCETSFSKRKLALIVVANTTDDGGCAVLLGCAPIGTPLEIQLIERAKFHKHKQGVSNAALIVWQAPLVSGKIAVHLL
jgi:hypothetical protein